jgi:hypothetical protein
MTFSAPYDRTVKIVTVLVCALLLAIGLVPHMPAFVWGLDILIIVACYAYSARGYVVSDRCITVKRFVGDVQIPLDGLREARAAASDDFRGCIRLWGNGGMFGFYGLFRTSKLGKCTWYITDKSKAVVVVTDAKTALFSPGDVSGFLAAVGAPASVPPILSTPAGGITARTVIGVAGALLGIAALALATLYDPGPPSYTLTPGALTIHDKFYSVTLRANAVDAGQIRVVDLTREPDWRPTARTNGFATRHYQSGWFRVASGKTVEMYRAGGDRLVLLPGKGSAATVLYQAQDPEQFAAQVRQEWLR